ncbi:MAG: DUF2169 domain-containing protein [Myxococcales bacterium]|nr:DUF2169 domain-containing protein [Myxococcales bacterium]
MKIVNTTPYRFHAFDFSTGPSRPALSLIVKGLFELKLGEAASAVPADEQEPIRGDEQHMDDLGRSLVHATDLCPLKTRGEVMLRGHCYPEGGRARAECDAGLEVGSIRKILKITGDRRFAANGTPTAPRPFEKMPLRWELTYGSLADPQNPLGRGVDAVPEPGEGQIVPLPNIEHPEHRMRAPGDRPPPVGFGPIAPSWAPRATRMGTRDARWAAFRAPLPPVDFDPRSFNAAPDDQQLDEGCYFRGDESFVLTHVRPEIGAFHGTLPGQRLRVFVALRAFKGQPGRFVEVEMRLDTVSFDADAERVTLVWRRPFAVRAAGYPEIEAVYVAEESLNDEPLSAEEHEARFRELSPVEPSEAELQQAEIDAQMEKAASILADGNVDTKVQAELRNTKDPGEALALLVRHAEAKMKELAAMTAKLSRG